jgi:hypothetical protein
MHWLLPSPRQNFWTALCIQMWCVSYTLCRSKQVYHLALRKLLLQIQHIEHATVGLQFIIVMEYARKSRTLAILMNI